MTDCNLAIADHHRVDWATTFWYRENIIGMLTMPIHTVYIHRDLIIRIRFDARGMADRDLVICDHQRTCWATDLWRWYDIAFVCIVTI